MIAASLLALTAQADPPNRTVRLWKVGDRTGGYVERIVVADDGEVVVGRTRADKKAFLFDVERWTMHDFGGATGEGGCAVNGAAPLRVDATGWTHEIWLACDHGAVIAYTWDGYTVERMLDADGAALTVNVDEQLEGAWWDPGSQLLYAASYPGTGTAGEIHVLDLFAESGVEVDGAVSGSFPKIGIDDKLLEGHVVDGYLVQAHGGQSVSSLLLGTGGSAIVPNRFNTVFNCDDSAPAPTGGIYCLDNLGSVAHYQPLTNILNVLPLGVLDQPRAVGANPDLSDGWLAVTGNQVLVWQMSPEGAILSEDDRPYYEGPEDADNPIDDIATSDGYLWGGGIAGNLHIVTARPWAYPGEIEMTPTSGETGTDFAFKFVYDQDVEWDVYLGGDRFGNGGVHLAEGADLADEGSIAQLVVDDRFVEGPNDIYVVATNDEGLTGHAVGTIDVDNPPKPPTLTDGSVEFDDGALTLTFAGIPDADLARYEVYVSQEPFDGADFATGGPDWDGTTSLKTPITLRAAPSERVTKRIAPLENHVTYYIGVRAWDAEGKEGPMSRVVKGTPRPVFTAAELAGEQGGSPCSTGPAAPVGALLLGLAALARRRRGVATFAAVALAAWLPSTGLAQAPRPDDDPWWRQDTTSAHADFELRYGVISLLDEDINTVYDANAHNMLQAEFGPQFWRFVEADLGFGFFQELSHAVDPTSGADSGKRTMLTWFPLALDGTLRAHFLDEQPVVPFVRYGWDYVLWSEKADDGFGGKETLRGGKFGTHYALGANVLLDLFQPGRASFLEAQSGINDSWLTLEWRRQRVDGRDRPWSGRADDEGLDFSGDAFTLGLKLDW